MARPVRFPAYLPALLLCLVVTAGCARSRRTDTPEPAPVGPPQVTVRWLGHGSFQLTSSIGLTVITDPFSPKAVGYPLPPNLRADVVLTSHETETANHVERIGGNPQLLRSRLAAGATRANGILFRGVVCGGSSGSGDDPSGGGANVAFAWTMDGVRFGHLGAPRRLPSTDELAQLGPVDVLFVPAGGPLTREDVDLVVTRLAPRILVPMSYRTPKATRLGLSPPDEILAGRSHLTRLPTPTFTVSRDTLPAEPVTLVPAVP